MNLDELYFKDNFTQDGEIVNLEVNQLTAECITSSNNTFSLDSSGNLSVNSIQSVTPINGGANLDSIYPVGSIYMNINATNPGTLFGGTWEQIRGRFLLGCGDNGDGYYYSPNSTGGEPSHTLTADEMPHHGHYFEATSTTAGNHNHEVFLNGDVNYPLILYPGWGTAGPVQSHIKTSQGYGFPTYTNYLGDHTHNIYGNTTGTGSSVAHNNLPPYLAVYIWKRIS